MTYNYGHSKSPVRNTFLSFMLLYAHRNHEAYYSGQHILPAVFPQTRQPFLKIHTPLYHKHASRFCTRKIHTPLYHKHAICIRKIHTHCLLQTRQEDTCSCKESLPGFVGFIFCLFVFVCFCFSPLYIFCLLVNYFFIPCKGNVGATHE